MYWDSYVKILLTTKTKKMKKIIKLSANHSSDLTQSNAVVNKQTIGRKRAIKNASLMVSESKASKAEKLREQKEQEFRVYLKYLKNYPLENHLMMWFEEHFPHPEFVGDLVEEINDMIWEMIKDYALTYNVKPVKKKLMSEEPDNFS